MSATMWKVADGARFEKFIIAQDARFQKAMREEISRMAHERGVARRAIVKPSLPKPTVRKPRDILFIVPTEAAPSPAATPLFTNLDKIVAEVCAHHRVSKSILYGERRGRPIVAARHELFYRLSQETRLSLTKIGQLVGGKDHSTVIHGIRRHEAMLRGASEEREAAGL